MTNKLVEEPHELTSVDETANAISLIAEKSSAHTWLPDNQQGYRLVNKDTGIPIAGLCYEFSAQGVIEICRAAFWGEIQFVNEGYEMTDSHDEDVIKNGLARLQATQEKIAEREEAEGVEAGRLWALQTAAADEVERVANSDDSIFNYSMTDAYGWAGVLYRMATDEEDSGRDDHERFMEIVFGKERFEPSDAMASGFVEGVRQIHQMT
jgi:hypothetical protein